MASLLVARNEFIRSLKNKKKLMLTLLFPLISIVVAIGVNSFMKPSINIGIINNEYVNIQVEEKINSIDRIKVTTTNKATINTDMILAKYLGVVEFKEDNQFEVFCLDKSVKLSMEKSISEIINSGKTDKIETLLGILEEGSLSVAQRSSGFIFITLMITCTMSASIMLKDKDDGILTRYSTTPNKLSSYILGNYIYNTANTIVQILIAGLVIYLLKIKIGISIQQFIFIGVIIAIVTSSIATLVTIISSSEIQASLVTSSVALIMALFGGVFLPIEKMTEMLKFISNISIAKWIITLTYLMENKIEYEWIFILTGCITLTSISIVIVSINVGNKKLS